MHANTCVCAIIYHVPFFVLFFFSFFLPELEGGASSLQGPFGVCNSFFRVCAPHAIIHRLLIGD